MSPKSSKHEKKVSLLSDHPITGKNPSSTAWSSVGVWNKISYFTLWWNYYDISRSFSDDKILIYLFGSSALWPVKRKEGRTEKLTKTENLLVPTEAAGLLYIFFAGRSLFVRSCWRFSVCDMPCRCLSCCCYLLLRIHAIDGKRHETKSSRNSIQNDKHVNMDKGEPNRRREDDVWARNIISLWMNSQRGRWAVQSFGLLSPSVGLLSAGWRAPTNWQKGKLRN